jgi:surface protein
MFYGAAAFNQDIGGWDTRKVKFMKNMFQGTYFNQYIGKWPIISDCDVTKMFFDCGVSKKTFEGKLYGNKIAEYFKLDNPNEFMVMDPFIRLERWKRRKNAVMFFSSISKMNPEDLQIPKAKTLISDSMQSNDSEEIIINPVLNALHSLDDVIYKEIVSFI